ncbi:hypothetical protein BH09ACT4_BH09ACT4_03300 [soil metagenome]
MKHSGMNKRIVAIVVVLVLAIGGAIGVLAAMRTSLVEPVETQPSDTQPSQPAAPDTAAPDTPATAGAYIDYGDSAIAQADGRILLFFHAPWCPQCRSIESDILAQGVPDGVTIIKVDYDSHQDLRQTYGVTLQTTFVEVDSAGAGLQNYIAYDDPHLDAVIAAML